MSTSNNWRRRMRQEKTPTLLVLVVILVAVFFVEYLVVRDGNLSRVAFVKPMNISNVLLQISTTGILAIGMTLIALAVTIAYAYSVAVSSLRDRRRRRSSSGSFSSADGLRLCTRMAERSATGWKPPADRTSRLSRSRPSRIG